MSKFTADLNGTRIVRNSLDAVKKAVTEGKKMVFEPFDALYNGGSSRGKAIKGLKYWRLIRVVNIVARRSRSRYGSREEVHFIDADQNAYDKGDVYEDSPAARKLAKEKEEHSIASEKRSNEDYHKSAKLRDALKKFALDKSGKRVSAKEQEN